MLALRNRALGRALREHPEFVSEVTDAVRDVLSKHLASNGVRMAAAVWIFSGPYQLKTVKLKIGPSINPPRNREVLFKSYQPGTQSLAIGKGARGCSPNYATTVKAEIIDGPFGVPRPVQAFQLPSGAA